MNDGQIKTYYNHQNKHKKLYVSSFFLLMVVVILLKGMLDVNNFVSVTNNIQNFKSFSNTLKYV